MTPGSLKLQGQFNCSANGKNPDKRQSMGGCLCPAFTLQCLPSLPKNGDREETHIYSKYTKTAALLVENAKTDFNPADMY